MGIRKHLVMIGIMAIFQIKGMRYPTLREISDSNRRIYATAPLFIKAIIDGDFERVKKEYEQNKEQLHVKHVFNIPLWYAFKHQRWKIAEYLIEQGSSIDCMFDYQNTVLHIAASWGIEKLVNLIVSKGGSTYIEAKNCHNETPLMVVHGFEKEKTGLCLVKSGASIIAKKFELQPCIIDYLYELEERLASLKLCVDDIDEQADKSIPCASNTKHYVFEAFKYGFEHNDKDHCRALINHGSEAIKEGVNAQDEAGNTLLHLIAESQPRDLRNAKAKLLLMFGANPTIENKAGLAPIQIAMKNYDRALLYLILSFDKELKVFQLKKDNKAAYIRDSILFQFLQRVTVTMKNG